MTHPVTRAAQSILDSDRNKCKPLGGQLDDVQNIEHSAENGYDEVVLTMIDGSIQRAMIRPDLVFRPDKREIKAADVHDAVLQAIFPAPGVRPTVQ